MVSSPPRLPSGGGAITFVCHNLTYLLLLNSIITKFISKYLSFLAERVTASPLEWETGEGKESKSGTSVSYSYST